MSRLHVSYSAYFFLVFGHDAVKAVLNIKIYSMIKSFIGGYYAGDKLFCLNSSLQTNL